ncbi:STYKc [Musa troglodytarum]|uniref:STYKc n=1 Tax=Musa troglodytarum TaxID=320322 RepID=A0A9E7JLP1_9LILI|nr:STYKc [Musa troglodytarum]
MKEGGGDGFVRADQIDLKSLDEQLERHLSRAWTMEKRKEEERRERRREEWEIDPSKLLIKGVIARGTFGTVHRGVYDGQDVAERKAVALTNDDEKWLICYALRVKLLDWGEEGNRTEAEVAALRAAFSQEVSVWHKLDHPNVTTFIGAAIGATDLNIQTENGHLSMPSNICCVVVEYLPGGALKSFLIKHHRRKLAFKIVVQMALDLASGSLTATLIIENVMFIASVSACGRYTVVICHIPTLAFPRSHLQSCGRYAFLPKPNGYGAGRTFSPSPTATVLVGPQLIILKFAELAARDTTLLPELSGKCHENLLGCKP